MEATTLPALVLGGEVASDQDATLASWSKALALPTVQGLVIGRSLLFRRTTTWRRLWMRRWGCCDGPACGARARPPTARSSW